MSPQDVKAPSDEQLRNVLISRYAEFKKISVNRQFRFYIKRLLWLIVIRSTYFSKRIFDILCSLVLIIILIPVFSLTALAIKLDSPGPVFFSQLRIGRWGQSFKMWKFRSMYTDAEARKSELMAKNEMDGGIIFKMKHDPRITRIGGLIRKTSIDELPQIWNVLIGDMSLVGPRPPVPSEVEFYSLHERQRLDVIPGITCIWQISGRSDIPFPQQVQLDIKYIESQSFWADIKILFQTIPAVFLGRGAY
jgi:exopolysaccharide biosynthesis polyprenyl glycosylphosphotransferase